MVPRTISERKSIIPTSDSFGERFGSSRKCVPKSIFLVIISSAITIIRNIVVHAYMDYKQERPISDNNIVNLRIVGITDTITIGCFRLIFYRKYFR